MYIFNDGGNIINAPCRDCPDRYLGCHDTCKKYISYKEALKEINEREYKKKRSEYRRGRNRHR